MVLAAVVVAVAMTEIVGGWDRLMRTDALVRFDWLHLGWTVYALFLSMLYWIGMWPYEAIPFVYVGQVWLLVVPTLFLVIVAYVLTPDVPESGELNLRDFYITKRRRIFSLPGRVSRHVACCRLFDCRLCDAECFDPARHHNGWPFSPLSHQGYMGARKRSSRSPLQVLWGRVWWNSRRCWKV